MEIERYIDELVGVIPHHVVGIRVSDYLLFAALLYQVDDTNRLIHPKFPFEVLLES